MMALWVFGLMVVGLLLIVDKAAPMGRPIIKITGVDGVAYYSNARSLLFDRDFDLTNEYAALHAETAGSYLETVPATGKPGTPFALGVSLLEVPFLALGHVVTLTSNGPSDGYSPVYFAAYYIGLIFFVWVGLTALFWLLRAIGLGLGASPRRSGWTAFVITLGLWPSTTLAYYTFASMSHAAEFMASSLFLLAWWRARSGDSLSRWAVCGLSLGLLTLCRWQAALFVLVPVVHDLMMLLAQALGHDGAARSPERRPPAGPWLKSRLLFASVSVLPLLPQLFQWRSVYGSWLTVPQGNVFFQLPPRHALHVLLSTHHGWFVWTPVTLLGMIGLVQRCRREAAVAVPLLLVVVSQVVLIGALTHAWAGHEAFGMRMLTSCLPIVAVGLSWLAFSETRAGRWALPVIGALCTLYTCVFAAQYRLDMLPKQDRLTASELIGDKLAFRSALQRRRAGAEAERALDEHQPERALELLLRTERAFGADRHLLQLLARAYEETGSREQQRDVEERLQRVLDSRLF